MHMWFDEDARGQLVVVQQSRIADVQSTGMKSRREEGEQSLFVIL